MTRTRLWVAAGLVGAAAVATVPALHAAAYPPGKKLQAEAHWNGTDKIQVTVSNAQEGCTYSLRSRGFTGTTDAASGTPDTGYTATGSISIGQKTGAYPVIVKSACSNGADETAQTKATVTPNKVTGTQTVTTGGKLTVAAHGWSPAASLVVALTGNGKTVTSKPLTTNEDGDVSYTLTAPKPGKYVVTILQSGTASQSFTVTVTGKVAQKAPKPKHKPAPKSTHTPKPKKH